MEHTVREFYQLVSPARDLTDERNALQMDRPESIRIPPFRSNKRLFFKLRQGQAEVVIGRYNKAFL